MAKATIDDLFDDSSFALGLTHAWRSDFNPLLSDPSWNESFNAKERERLEKEGIPLPPAVDEKGILTDRDLDAQIKAELAKLDKERPDLSFPAQLDLAKDRILAKQRQSHRNAGAYDLERAELRQIIKERPVVVGKTFQELARERVSAKESAKVAIEGPQCNDNGNNLAKGMPQKHDILGASVESLMKKGRTGGKQGGGKSGRKNRTKKKGTWTCKECHLEYCPHRPKSSSRGPKPKEGVTRRVRKMVRLSDNTVEVLGDFGLASSDLLACSAIALKEKRPLNEVVQEWKERTP